MADFRKTEIAAGSKTNTETETMQTHIRIMRTGIRTRRCRKDGTTAIAIHAPNTKAIMIITTKMRAMTLIVNPLWAHMKMIMMKITDFMVMKSRKKMTTKMNMIMNAVIQWKMIVGKRMAEQGIPI